jgi:hypothetical protein
MSKLKPNDQKLILHLAPKAAKRARWRTLKNWRSLDLFACSWSCRPCSCGICTRRMCLSVAGGPRFDAHFMLPVTPSGCRGSLEVGLVSKESFHCVDQRFARTILRHEPLHTRLPRLRHERFSCVHGKK